MGSLLNRQTAVRDLQEQKQKIAHQEELIDHLAGNGQPTDDAKDMLQTMQNVLSVMELDLRRYPAPR